MQDLLNRLQAANDLDSTTNGASLTWWAKKFNFLNFEKRNRTFRILE